MLAPIRLTNAAAQLPLRGQVRRKETHPHSTPHRPRPYEAGYDLFRCGPDEGISKGSYVPGVRMTTGISRVVLFS